MTMPGHQAAVAGTVPPMTSMEVLGRVDVVTDKLATRLDAAVDKLGSRLETATDKLAHIETKVDMIPQDIATLRGDQARLTERVRRLETWRSFWTGATAVVALLLSSGVAVALLVHTRH